MKIHYEETTLPNGVKVATSSMPHVGSVTMGIWVGVGGRYESQKFSGMSHFIEHLLFKGTQRRTARDISEEIEGRGGYFNAFTQEESTCYYARVADEHTWPVFDVLADMYLRPKFDRDDIDRERGVILEEIMMYRDRPHYVAEEKLMTLLYRNHALGRSILGPPENIKRVSRADIVGFRNSRYTADNLVIVFTGNVDHEECVRKVRKYFSRFSRHGKPRYTRVKPGTGRDPVGVYPRPSEQVHLAMGFRIFGRTDRRRYALKLLSVLLGENMSSRLFQVVREKHGLAYSIHTGASMFHDSGIFMIQSGLDRERFPKAMKLIGRELKKIREKPVGFAELERARDYAVGQLQINLESTTSQMIWIGENLVSYGAFRDPAKAIERLRKVTREDISKTAAYMLKPSRLSVSAVVPEDMKGAEGMIKDGMSVL